MKKQARIDVRDYLDINRSGNLSDILLNNTKGTLNSLFNILSDDGKETAKGLATVTGDMSGAISKTPMKIKGLGNLQKVIDAYNQYYPEMNTQVQLGMVDSLRNSKRMEDLKPNFLTKLLGAGALDDDVARFLEKNRVDHFMPVSNTVHVFSENPSVLAHELGHAADFTYRHKSSPGRMMAESSAINSIPFLWGLGTLDEEMAATNNAWKALNKAGVSDDIMKNLSRDLTGAGGTYAGSTLGSNIGLLAGLAGGSVLGGGEALPTVIGGQIGADIGANVGIDSGAFIGRNVGKYIDVPKYLMSATLPEPAPAADRLKIHAKDIWNDIKSGNILAYPRDTFNSVKYSVNDLKEMLMKSNFMSKLKGYFKKIR